MSVIQLIVTGFTLAIMKPIKLIELQNLILVTATRNTCKITQSLTLVIFMLSM